MKDFTLRQLQVGEHIKRTLARLFSDGEFDKDFSENVSITEVRLASGLKHANIFISCLTEEESIRKSRILNQNAREVRFILAKHLEVRFVPQISFEADLTGFQAEKIDDIFKSEKVKKDIS